MSQIIKRACNRKLFLLFLLLTLVLLLPGVFAFEANLDKIVYLSNATLTITGTSDYNSTSINATFYDASETSVGTANSTSSSSGEFSFSFN